MQIRDIKIKFEGDALTKYGFFALLAWFLIDIMELSERFKIVTVKKRRNRKNRMKRRKSHFLTTRCAWGLS